MLSIPKFFFNDSSAAIEEAFHQRDLGHRVSVGRESFDGKWYVRVTEATAKPRGA